MVFSFGVLHPDLQQDGVWIMCLCAATCYQYLWDITMDWGLVQLRVDSSQGGGKGSAGGRVRLRFRPEQQLSLGPPWVYYAVLSGNFVLRFAWAITYVPREIHAYSSVSSYVFNNFQTVMAAAEIVRRMVWGFLRLEWEHIEKTGAAPVSLSRQHGLVREAGAVAFSQDRREQGQGGGLSFSMDSGAEGRMDKMGIGSGYDHSHSKGRGGSGGVADIFSYNLAAHENKHTHTPRLLGAEDEEEGGGEIEMSASPTATLGSSSREVEDLVGDGDGDDEEDEEDMMVTLLLSWLPFDIAAAFPFFLFQASLQKTVRKYPRHRFRARVVEATALTALILGVMSVSALTKMHSAGYI